MAYLAAISTATTIPLFIRTRGNVQPVSRFLICDGAIVNRSVCIKKGSVLELHISNQGVMSCPAPSISRAKGSEYDAIA